MGGVLALTPVLAVAGLQVCFYNLQQDICKYTYVGFRVSIFILRSEDFFRG